MLKIKIVGIQNTKEFEIPFQNGNLENIAIQFLPPSGGYSAYYNKQFYKPEQWSQIFPTDGSKVIFLPDFGDPASITALLYMSAQAAAAAGFWSTVTYLAIYTAVTIGLTIGVGYLIKALSPQPKQYDAKMPTAYDWDPHTSAQQGGIQPVTYGTFKSFGNIIGNYVKVDPDNKKKLIMNILNHYGRGPVKAVTDIRINDQPLTNFDTIDTEVRCGLVDQDCIPFFDKVYRQHHPAVEVTKKNGPYEWEVPGDDYDDLEIIIRGNLYHFHESGKADDHTVAMKMQIKEMPDGQWQKFFEDQFSNKGTAPFWKAFKMSQCGIIISRGKKYKFKIEKTRKDQNESRTKNQVIFDYATEISNDSLTYPGSVMVGVSGILTDDFSSIQDITAVIEGKIVQQWDDDIQDWVLDYSDNPGYVALDVLTQPIVSGDGVDDPWEIKEYEGMLPERVNTDDVYDLALWCITPCPDGKEFEEPLITFNGIFDQASSTWESLLKVCQIARCVPIYRGNRVEFVIDKPSERAGVLSAGNIVQGSFEETFLPKIDRVSEIEVAYNDIADNYERAVLSTYSAELKSNVNKATFDFLGVVKKSEAWRLAKFHLAHNELLKRKIKLQSDIDCLSYRLGSRLGLQFDLTNWNCLKQGCRGSGRIISYTHGDNEDRLKLDYNISEAIEAGNTYELLVRLKDDTQVIKIINSFEDDVVVVDKFTTELLPQENDLWVIGKQNLVVKDFRLLNWKRSQELTFELELIDYNEGLWASDLGEPLVPNINSTPAKSAKQILKPITPTDIKNRIPDVVIDGEVNDTLTTTNLKWTDNSPQAGFVEWSAEEEGEETPILVSYKGSSYEIEPDSTDKEFIFWDIANPSVFQSTNVKSEISGIIICHNEDGVAQPYIGYILPGQVLVDGSIGAAPLLKAMQPFMHNIVFASGNSENQNKHNAVHWSAGTIKFSDSSTQNINAGQITGLGDGVTRYIYFSVGNSNLQNTSEYTSVATETTRLLATIIVSSDSEQEIGILLSQNVGGNWIRDFLAPKSISTDQIGDFAVAVKQTNSRLHQIY